MRAWQQAEDFPPDKIAGQRIDSLAPAVSLLPFSRTRLINCNADHEIGRAHV